METVKTVSKTLHISPTTVIWENGLIIKNVTKIVITTTIHTIHINEKCVLKKIDAVDGTFTLTFDDKVVCNCTYKNHKWNKYPYNNYIEQLIGSMKRKIVDFYNIHIT